VSLIAMGYCGNFLRNFFRLLRLAQSHCCFMEDFGKTDCYDLVEEIGSLWMSRIELHLGKAAPR